jgi:hypothetical protein
MDALKSILIFCNDDEHAGVAMATSLQVENYDHAPMMITAKPEIYQLSRILLTDPGDWDLKCFSRTRDLWLERIVVLRGDISYPDETITLILAHAGKPMNYFYFAGGKLVAFSARSKDLKLALDSVLGDKYADISDWGKLVETMKTLTGRVYKTAVNVGGVND